MTASSAAPAGGPAAGRRRVALLGPFGYGNLGDAVIVDAAIAALRRGRPDWELFGIVLDPDDVERRHGIPAVALSRTVEAHGDTWWARWSARRRASPRRWVRQLERLLGRVPTEVGLLWRAHRALAGTDALVVCGSGQLQDRWGGGGAWSAPYALLRWSLLARLRGASVIVLGVGAGPVDSRLARRFFRWALALAVDRSFRDEWSREFVVSQIGGPAGDPVVPDLAFGLPTLVPCDRAARPGRRGRMVGIGPIGYHRPGTWPETDPERYARYLETVVEVAVGVLASGDRVRFLRGEAHYDQFAVDDVIEQMEQRGVDTNGLEGTAPGEIASVDDLLDAIRGCDVVVASRFHNVLLALASGRPVVALSYQEKIDSLMARFGQSEMCLAIGTATAAGVLDRLDGTRRSAGFGEQAAALVEQSRRALEEHYARIVELV